MFKNRLLVAVALVLTLSIALFSVAILITRPEAPVSIISTANCNSNQTSTSGSSSSSANVCHKRLLVFSKTGGFRHASIPDAIRALKMLAAEHSFRADFTEDATVLLS